MGGSRFKSKQVQVPVAVPVPSGSGRLSAAELDSIIEDVLLLVGNGYRHAVGGLMDPGAGPDGVVVDLERNWAALGATEGLPGPQGTAGGTGGLGSPVLGPGAAAALARDDSGWVAFSGYMGSATAASQDMVEGLRRNYVKACRVLFATNPFARQIVTLWTNFGLGRAGVRWSLGEAGSGEGGEGDDKPRRGKPAPVGARYATRVQETWNDLRNHVTFSFQGQLKSCYRLLCDGESFYAFFIDPGNRTGPVKVRNINSLRVAAVISSPKDEDSIDWYVISGEVEGEFYLMRDWASFLSGEPVASPSAEVLTALGVGEKSKVTPVPTAVIYHCSLFSLGRRGIPLMGPSSPWVRAMTQFMSARNSVMQAIARIAYLVKTKGTAEDLANIRSRLGTRLSTDQHVDTNPAMSPGSVLALKGETDVSKMPMETGAQAAATDGAMLGSVVGLGSGIMPTYLGFDSKGLAAAASMDLPMRAAFETFQNVLDNLYTDLMVIAIMLRDAKQRDYRKIKSSLAIQFPTVNPRDLTAFLQSVSRMMEVTPELAHLKSWWGLIFGELDVDRVEDLSMEVVNLIRERGGEDEAVRPSSPGPSPNAPEPVPFGGGSPGDEGSETEPGAKGEGGDRNERSDAGSKGVRRKGEGGNRQPRNPGTKGS